MICLIQLKDFIINLNIFKYKKTNYFNVYYYKFSVWLQ